MKNAENGIYFIDSDFNIIYYNHAVKEMYPEAETGRHCYDVLACRSNPCPYCPLKSAGMQNSFYNSVRREWISAQAAQIELPPFGPCMSITFSRSWEEETDETAGADGKEKQAFVSAFADSDRTGMIGGYCEEGFPLFFANEKMIKMLGYDDYDDFYRGINGLVGNTIHPDDMAQVVADIGPSYYVGLEYETIYRMPRKDGTWFWTYDKGRVVQAENGRLAIVSYCTDITDSFQRQRRLEEQNNILQRQNRLMEFINDGMPGGYHRCAVTEGYPFLYVSEKFLNMLGFTRQELKELFDDKFLNLVHPDDRIYLYTEAENLSHKENLDAELGLHYRIRTKDGYLQVLDTSRLTEFEGQRFFQGVIIDISDERQTREHIESLKVVQSALENALKRETMFRHRLDNLQHEIMDSISCGVIAYTLPDRNLLAVNDVARKLIGCGPDDDPIETLKIFLQEKVAPENRERVCHAGSALQHSGDMIVQEYRADIGGRTVYIHSNVKHLENADGQPYILVTMLDITTQAVLTEEIEKERKLYRNALQSGSEFSFLFDVTDGMIREEFVTAHGMNLIRKLGFSVPVPFDLLLQRYVEDCRIEFADDAMIRNFTCAGIEEAYRNGVTKLVTEYYNPRRDTFLRVNALLSVDEYTGHLHAAVVADDVSEIRKKDRLQQEALKAAYNEIDVRMNTILDGLSGGFKIADVNDGYRYTYISEGAARLQGYTVEEFLARFGSRVTLNIHESDGEAALAEANRQIAEKGHYAVKYRVPHKDGSIKWVMDHGKLIEVPGTNQKYLYILMQDITDLEERNMQISKVLTMQEHMAESLGNGIFAYTLPERKVLILNKEARRMFASIGSEESAGGRDIISKIDPGDLPQVRNAYKRLVSPGDTTDYMFHSTTLTGDTRTFKCTTKLLSFADGQKYILSAMTDITEQKLTELRLENERHRYREALTLGSSGSFTVDLTRGVMDQTPAAKDGIPMHIKLRLTPPVTYDHFVSEWLSDKRIASPNVHKLAVIRSREALMDACVNGTSIIDIEYNLFDENKYYHLMVLLYKSNEHIFANFIAYDITSDRTEANRRGAVIDSLGRIYSALYHFSFKEDACTMLKANDDVYADFSDRCSLSEFCRRYPQEYAEPEYRDAVADFLNLQTIQKTLANSDTAAIEFKRKNLGWFRVHLVAAKRDKKGVVTSVVFAGTVIDKQKRQELIQQEALRAAYESANIANAAKTNFLANMSHDIRTPMNAIIGMTAIAGTHLDDRERVSDCLAKISLSSKHLLGIINDVLDMSKIESGKIDLQEEEFNLTDLLDNLLAMSRTEVAAKNHTLSVFVHNIDHENVIGDSQRLQQVFMNLMSNAIKYTPDGGKIKLSIYEKPTNKPQVGCYEVVFEDNGIGMSEDFVQHVYEPFARATDDPRLEHIQGTGLGMSIAKSIIQMMNGDIKVKSKLNEGTTFTVTFFLRVRTDGEAIDYEKFVHLPILVADDDSVSCEYACSLLQEIGMDGEWVLSGEEAVEKVVERHEAGNDYFAVVVDWKMPGMDGVETTREIRRRLGKSIPIIIISAYDWSDIELAARAAGANAFISKPMFKSRVVHVFNELMGAEKAKTASSALESLAGANFGGKRALLVEDNALNAEIASEILRMTGLELEFAVNGKEAVDIMTNVEDGHFDVIFMDIQMPIMNGYEATRAIRSLPGDYAKSVPIFAMTANAFAEDVSAAKNAGMNEHIAKPLDFDQLTETLKKWLT